MSKVLNPNNNSKAGFRNTELCVDLKTFLRKDVLMNPGVWYPGLLMRDLPKEEYGFDEYHYTFIEALPSTAGKRNPRVFAGEYITITRRDDGSLRPNLRPMKVDENFSVDAYAMGVMNELRNALKGFVEEKDKTTE